ncbi:MAG: hypothetical protein ACRCXE_01640 [Metamycoplasmataceae bacterium]
MNQEQKDIIELYWKKYKKKYLHARLLFVFINVFIFAASALLIVLNLFTLKYNDIFPEIKEIFIALAIITGAGTFCISLVSAFQWKEKKNHYNIQIEAISKISEHNEEMSNEEFFELLRVLETSLINEKM